LTVNAGGPGSTTVVGDLAVEYRTVNKTADGESPRDYIPTSNIVYFYGGIQERKISVSIEDDHYFEYPNEYFDIEIVSIKYNNIPSTLIVPNTVVDYSSQLTIDYSNQLTSVNVMDDEDFGSINFILQTTPSTAIDSTGVRIQESKEWVLYTASETNGTTSTCTLNIGRTGRDVFDTDLRVAYQLLPTTASILDFENSTEWVEFIAGGAPTRSISINILHDDIYEYPDEEVQVVLHNLQYRKSDQEAWSSSPTETLSTVKLGDRAQAILIIQDDSDSGVLSFVESNVMVSEATDELLTVTITRTGRSFPNSTVSVRVKSVDNNDIKEIQSIYCQATTGYFNLSYTESSSVVLHSKIHADAITSPITLETQLLNDLGVNFTVTYSNSKDNYTQDHSSTSGPCTKEGRYIHLEFNDLRGDQKSLQVVPLTNEMTLARNDFSEIQNITCFANEGNFVLSWGDAPTENIIINAVTTTASALRTMLLTLAPIDDVVVAYTRLDATNTRINVTTPCSTGGTSIVLDFIHWKQRTELPMLRAQPTYGDSTLTRDRVYDTFTVSCAAVSGRAKLHIVFNTGAEVFTVASTGVTSAQLQTMINAANISNVQVQYGSNSDGVESTTFCNATGQSTTFVFEDLLYVDQPISIEVSSDVLADRLILNPVYREQQIYCQANEGSFILAHDDSSILIPAVSFTEAEFASAIQSGLEGIEAVAVSYSTANAPGPCTSVGQNITIGFTSAANLIGVQDIVLKQWLLYPNETTSLKRDQMDEVQSITCKATGGTLNIYYGSDGPLVVNALEPPAGLKALFESYFNAIDTISVTSDGSAAVCTGAGATTNITFVSTMHAGNQPTLRISTSTPATPLVLTPPGGTVCSNIQVDYPVHALEAQESTCTLKGGAEHQESTLEQFFYGGSAQYDYSSDTKAKTLTFGKNELSGTSAAINVVGATRSAIKNALEVLMGGVGEEVNNVAVTPVSTHLHPAIDGTRQSALHTGWGPSIGASQPATCNGHVEKIHFQFDTIVENAKFATHGFFKNDWEVHVYSMARQLDADNTTWSSTATKNVSMLDGSNYHLKCPAKNESSGTPPAWHSTSMHGVQNGYVGTLKQKISLKQNIAPTSDVQHLSLVGNEGGLPVNRGDVVFLVNTGAECKAQYPYHDRPAANATTGTNGTLDINNNTIVNGTFDTPAVTYKAGIVSTGNNCSSYTTRAQCNHDPYSTHCYWDPWVPDDQPNCVHFRTACLSNYLVHDVTNEDAEDRGLWYAPQYTLDTTEELPNVVAQDTFNVTLWQCGMVLHSLVVETQCEDLCTYQGATTQVEFQCCDSLPCASTAPPLFTAIHSDSAVVVPSLFARTNAAKLSTVVVKEWQRGLSGTSTNTNGAANHYYPYDRCGDDHDRLYERQLLTCNATSVETSFRLTHPRTNKYRDVATNATVNDLKEALRVISNGNYHQVEQTNVPQQLTVVPLVRGSGGTSYIQDRVQIIGAPLTENGVVSSLKVRFTNVQYYKPNRHYLYALRKRNNNDDGGGNKTYPAQSDQWTIRAYAQVHTSATTDVMSAVVAQIDKESPGTGTSTTVGLHVEVGDYIGLVNVGWEVATGMLCASLANRTGCIVASGGECFWDSGTHYYYTDYSILTDGVSDVEWGPDANAYDSPRCRLRQEYAQLWLDSSVVSTYHNGAMPVGVYTDLGSTTFLKPLGGASSFSSSSRSGLDCFDCSFPTNSMVTGSIAVRGWLPNVQPGFQVAITPYDRICASSAPLTYITFVDPLDSGNVGALSVDGSFVALQTVQEGFINHCPVLTSQTTVEASNDATIAAMRNKEGYGGRLNDEDGASITVEIVRKGFSGSTMVNNGALVRVLEQEAVRGFAVGTARNYGYTINGTSDYTSVDTVLTFEPFVTELTFTVEINNDQYFEFPNEKLRLYLTNATLISENEQIPNPVSITFGIQDMTVEILDDGDTGKFSFLQRYFTVVEDDTQMFVTVTRSDRDFNDGANGGELVLTYATTQRWAEPGLDYNKTTGTLVFQPTQSEMTFAVPINQDDKFEYPDEEFDVGKVPKRNIMALTHLCTHTVALFPYSFC